MQGVASLMKHPVELCYVCTAKKPIVIQHLLSVVSVVKTVPHPLQIEQHHASV